MKGRAVSVGGVAFNNLIPPPLLTICAMRSPVVLVVCLPIQWLNVAIWGNKKGCRKIYDTPSCQLKGSHFKCNPLSCPPNWWLVAMVNTG